MLQAIKFIRKDIRVLKSVPLNEFCHQKNSVAEWTRSFSEFDRSIILVFVDERQNLLPSSQK